MTALAVSVATAAQMLDVDPTTIYALCAKNEIRAKKQGRKIVIPVESLKAYLNDLPDYSPDEDAS